MNLTEIDLIWPIVKSGPGRISTNFIEFVNLAKSLPFHFILVLSFEKEILFIFLESHFQPQHLSNLV
jgi:hypothetical protein